MITIDDVLKCEKIINKKRRPDFVIDQRHYKMNIDLECDNPRLKTVMFGQQLSYSLFYGRGFTSPS